MTRSAVKSTRFPVNLHRFPRLADSHGKSRVRVSDATQQYFEWATQSDNLALGNPENMARGSLGKITLAGCAYIGGGVPGSWASRNVSPPLL